MVKKYLLAILCCLLPSLGFAWDTGTNSGDTSSVVGSENRTGDLTVSGTVTGTTGVAGGTISGTTRRGI